MPDTSNMYKFWSTSADYTVTVSFSTYIYLPTAPELLVIIEDQNEVLYKLPIGTKTEGFYISYYPMGASLFLSEGPAIDGYDQADVHIDVYVWYR